MVNKIVVIAGNAREFNLWREKSNVPEKHAIYVSGPDAARGYHIEPWQVVRYGSYATRRDIDDIEMILKLCAVRA